MLIYNGLYGQSITQVGNFLGLRGYRREREKGGIYFIFKSN